MNIRRILGAIVCALKRKHRRGKRIGFPVNGLQLFKCDRCGKTHSRKVKPALGTAAKGDSQ